MEKAITEGRNPFVYKNKILTKNCLKNAKNIVKLSIMVTIK